jgi:predicted DCC family thiol-disulfide oxidoreductase YuxK
MFRSNCLRSCSLEDEPQRNSDVIAEILEFFLESAFASIEFCGEKFHQGTGIQFRNIQRFRLIDSEQVEMTIELLVHLLEELVIEDEIVVQLIPILSQKFRDNVFCIFAVTRFREFGRKF